MNQVQRLFLVQARSTYKVYHLLKESESVHHCHTLHFLQMATELLGKSHAWKNGPIGKSHKSLVTFIKTLSSNKKAQKLLGYERKNEQWIQTIRKIIPLAESLQKMAPSLSEDGPNPEYPWPSLQPVATPAEHTFEIWKELTKTAYGLAFLKIIQRLFAQAEEYL